MQAEFWLNKWQKNEIGFHLPKAHGWLVSLWPKVNTGATLQTVFVPLCGKSLDLDFFLEQGHKVIANELSEQAVIDVFERLQLPAEITKWVGGKCYSSDKLSIYVGDFFQLTDKEIRHVDCIYDRAALIALPETMRTQYTQHLLALCPSAKQCLITLDYDQQKMSGPPFALTDAEVNEHYEATHLIQELKSADIIENEPRFKQNGLPELIQRVYQLTPKPTV